MFTTPRLRALHTVVWFMFGNWPTPAEMFKTHRRLFGSR